MPDAPESRELFDRLRGLVAASWLAHAASSRIDLAREALAADLKWRNPPWHHELHRPRAWLLHGHV